jgi:chromosome segregation ATPase
MNKKSELQQEFSTLQRERESLQARRAKLSADLESISTRAATLRASISASLIDGKDVSRDRDTLAKLSTEETTLQDSITLADEKIRLLDVSIQDKERGIKMQDFLEVERKAESLFLQFVDKIEAALSDLIAIEPIYQELRLIAPIENGGDHARIMQQAYGQIRRMFLDGYGVKYQLDEIRKNYGSYISEARKQ